MHQFNSLPTLALQEPRRAVRRAGHSVPNRGQVKISAAGSEVLSLNASGKRVGLSSRPSEFQEKMRLGGIWRLSFAHLSS